MYNPNYYYPPVSPMAMMQYAGGGRVAQQQKHGLAAAAEQLRRRGRDGDTILAHISPEEAGILKLLGGSGGINPHTGLPEYKKFWKNITIKKAAAPIAATVAFVASGGNPAAASAAAAAVKAAQGAPLKDIAKTAALTYVGSSLGGGGASAGGGSAAGGGAAELASVGATGYGLTGPIAGAGGAAAGAIDVAPISGSAAGGTSVTPIDVGTAATTPAATVAAPGAGTAGAGVAAPSTASGLANLGSAALDTVTGGIKSLMPSSLGDAVKLASTAALGYGALTSAEQAKEQQKAAQEELARQAAERAKDIANAQNVMAKYPFSWSRPTAEDVVQYGIGAPRRLTPQPTIQAAEGGALDDLYPQYSEDSETMPENEEMTYDDELGYDYAYGGLASLPPRYLSGGGDGMSDSIPARISGKQEARLADGEFVIPADVVSHLGNGSSNAGAKKLYAMMDRIRKARTGKTRQAPAVKTSRLLPA